MTHLTIACSLYNAETTRAGDLSVFFEQLKEIERKSERDTERIVLVDKKTTDNTAEIAKSYCEPGYFHFTDFANAKNQLIERANGSWVFIAEPDMKYDTDKLADIIKASGGMDYKCVEAWQKIKFPNGGDKKVLYTTLMRNSARFYGMAFPTPKLFPHEECGIDDVIGEHYIDEDAKRIEGRRPLIKKELSELASVKGNVEENYWAAKRYFEIASLGHISDEQAHERIHSLLTEAIKLEPGFGPAYYELGAHVLRCGCPSEALDLATKGFNKGYMPCQVVINGALEAMGSNVRFIFLSR